MGQVVLTQTCCCSEETYKDIGRAQVVAVNPATEEEDVFVVNSGLGIIPWPKKQADAVEPAIEGGMAIRMLNEIDEALIKAESSMHKYFRQETPEDAGKTQRDANVAALEEQEELRKTSSGEPLENLVDTVLTKAEDSLFKCCCTHESGVDVGMAPILSVEPGSEHEASSFAIAEDHFYLPCFTDDDARKKSRYLESAPGEEEVSGIVSMQQMGNHRALPTELYYYQAEADDDGGNTTVYSVESFVESEEDVEEEVSEIAPDSTSEKVQVAVTGEHAIKASRPQVYTKRTVTVRKAAVRATNELDGSICAPVVVGASTALDGSLRAPALVGSSHGSDGSLRATAAANEQVQSQYLRREDAGKNGETTPRVSDLDGSLRAPHSGRGKIVRLITTTYPPVITDVKTSMKEVKPLRKDVQPAEDEKNQVMRQRSAVYVNKKKTKNHLAASGKGNYNGDD
mmetsp:Transcript_33005/g.58613  ORF Transcript_33005/g.58613 Transcript_33005/m.58613 type:complete len:456 (-) Transcript_33005:133-1500(-)